MFVWELHEALARSLNDPYINYVTDDPIRATTQNRIRFYDVIVGDGMRFTAMQRSLYLDRAIMSIIRDAMMQVMHLPRVQASAILQKLFPSLTVTVYNQNFAEFQNREALWIYSVLLQARGVYSRNHSPRARSLYAPPNNLPLISNVPAEEFIFINVPILTEVEAKNLFGVQSTIRPDLVVYCVLRGNILTFYGERIWDLLNSAWGNRLHITYMTRPRRIIELRDTDLVDMEDIYFDNIVHRATLYGLHDSGLLGSANMAMPLLDLPTIKIGPIVQSQRNEQ